MSESKITIVIRLETYWGRVDERTIDVEPGLAWDDRAADRVRSVALEMDRECVRKFNEPLSKVDA